MAGPERLIPRFARHPFGAHFVRLSAREASLGGTAASLPRRRFAAPPVSRLIPRYARHPCGAPLAFVVALSAPRFEPPTVGFIPRKTPALTFQKRKKPK